MNVIACVFDNIVIDLKVFHVEIGFISFESDYFFFVFVGEGMLSTHSGNLLQIYEVEFIVVLYL